MLWKKMFRDLLENKGTYLACIIIMIIGILTFTTFSLVLDNLKLSQEDFYKNQNFSEGFIKVKALPFNEVKRLAHIIGINQIEGRIVKDVQVLSPDSKENIYLRLVSIDIQKENPLNGVLLKEGVQLNPKDMNIWIDNKFFEAHNLKLNEEVEIITEGKKRKLNIVGVGQSPEFIYALRTAHDLYPSPETFGIAFMPLEIMSSFYNQKSFNELSFTLKPGVRFTDIKDVLEEELKPYGLINLISREEQISHLLLSEELKTLETMARAMPIMFLSIAAMILYITLKRLTEQQRSQIGILKALGYTHQEIIVHYLSYPLIIALVGSILGGLLGTILSYPFTEFYLLFFNMPNLQSSFSLWYFFGGIILSLLFSLFSGYQGSKKVLALEPATALKSPAPLKGGRVWLEKVHFFWNMLTVQGMMAVRNISRNKGRSLFIFLGIMFCFAISGFTWSMNDLMQKMLFDQYEKVEVYDVKLTLAQPLDQKKISRELEAFPGVINVEALAEIPVTLNNNWLKKDVVIIGIPSNSQLYNILDKNNNRLLPPQDGLLLSERLATVLKAQVGTKLSLEKVLLKDQKTDKKLEVTDIIPQYVGINAYMELNALQNFLGEGPLATSLMLSTPDESITPLKEKYRQSTAIISIEERNEKLDNLQKMMASFGSLIYVYALIGVIIGFSIIYSSSIITLSERSRELASMMVLGMTPKEVLSVVTFEQWFLGIGAMLAGMPAAKFMFIAISKAVSSDLFSVPAVMSFKAFFLAFLVTTTSIWIAQQAAARKVRSLSLAEVLKARE